MDGVPRTLNLKQMLQHYIDHQVDVVIRRTKFELRQAEERDHIVQGLLIALDHLDEVIATIRALVVAINRLNPAENLSARSGRRSAKYTTALR